MSRYSGKSEWRYKWFAPCVMVALPLIVLPWLLFERDPLIETTGNTTIYREDPSTSIVAARVAVSAPLAAIVLMLMFRRSVAARGLFVGAFLATAFHSVAIYNSSRFIVVINDDSLTAPVGEFFRGTTRTVRFDEGEFRLQPKRKGGFDVVFAPKDGPAFLFELGVAHSQAWTQITVSQRAAMARRQAIESRERDAKIREEMWRKWGISLPDRGD